MKNILIVMATLYNGGAEKSLVNFLNELEVDKYNVDLLLFEKRGIFLEQVPEYVNILDTPRRIEQLYNTDMKKVGAMLPIKLFGSFFSKVVTSSLSELRGYRWKKFYKKFIPELPKHYDVAFAYISNDVMRYVVDKVTADRKIVTVHNDYHTANYSHVYDEPYFEKMDYIASISDICVNILKEEFPNCKEKIVCLPNITSSTVIKKRANEFMPQEYDTNITNILSVGRLNEQKGFDMAIDAAAIMKQRGTKFKWFIIGNGELQAKLEAQIKEKKVEDCFVLLGVRENPYPYVKNCDLFIQPSRFEGKSVVLDEAKILIKPIIATNYPTVKDQLEDGKEGKIVPMNSEGIADGIMSVIRNEYDIEKCVAYLSQHEYGNQEDINLYYNLLDN